MAVNPVWRDRRAMARPRTKNQEPRTLGCWAVLSSWFSVLRPAVAVCPLGALHFIDGGSLPRRAALPAAALPRAAAVCRLVARPDCRLQISDCRLEEETIKNRLGLAHLRICGRLNAAASSLSRRILDVGLEAYTALAGRTGAGARRCGWCAGGRARRARLGRRLGVGASG